MIYFEGASRLTEERESNELDTHISKADVEASCNSTRTYSRDVEHARHERFLSLCRISSDMVLGVRDAVGPWSELWKEI